MRVRGRRNAEAIIFFLMMFCVIGSPVNASIFSQSFSGTVNPGVIDTKGLFGPTSGRLAGDRIDIAFSFDPAIYATFSSCNVDCQYYQANVAGAATFSVSMNGIAHDFVSTARSSNITYDNFSTFGEFSEYFELGMFEHSSFELRTPYPVTYGEPIQIGGGNDAVYSYFFYGDFFGGEIIGFTPDPRPVSEPSSIWCLAGTVAGFGCLRSKRRVASTVFGRRRRKQHIFVCSRAAAPQIAGARASPA